MFPLAFCARSVGWALISGLGLTSLSGCVDQGFSGLGDELQRRKGAFAIVSASHERAVVSARGKQVAIEPTDGLCLARESLEASQRSVFVLIGDCFFEESTSNGRSARGELTLPRTVPGIITVSISGDGVFTENRAHKTTLGELSEFLASPKGTAMLGRGSGQSAPKLVRSQQIGDGLYVQVQDTGTESLSFLSSKFWRAFVELNDRLAVVTISGFRDRPLPEEEMLDHLVGQVKRLRTANRLPISEETTYVAAASTTPVEDLRVPAEVQSIKDIKPTSVVITTSGKSGEPELWPIPNRRGGDESDSGADDTIGRHAPLNAPNAPKRRRRG